MTQAGSANSQRLSQYTNRTGNRAKCYAELAVSSLAMAVIIVSNHRAEAHDLAGVARLNTPPVTHLGILTGLLVEQPRGVCTAVATSH